MYFYLVKAHSQIRRYMSVCILFALLVAGMYAKLVQRYVVTFMQTYSLPSNLRSQVFKVQSTTIFHLQRLQRGVILQRLGL